MLYDIYFLTIFIQLDHQALKRYTFACFSGLRVAERTYNCYYLLFYERLIIQQYHFRIYSQYNYKNEKKKSITGFKKLEDIRINANQNILKSVYH